MLMVMLISSCKSIVEVDVPENERTLAVYGFLSAGEEIAVTVYRTAGIEEIVTQEDLQMHDAIVIISHNGVRDTLDYQSDGRYALDWVATSGASYQLEVESEGFPTIYAETTVPLRPDVRGQSKYVGPAGERGTSLADYLLELSLSDLPGTQYYQLVVYQLRREGQGEAWGAGYFICNELIFRNDPADVGSQSVETPPRTCDLVYFADDSFDGKQKEFALKFDPWYTDIPEQLKISVTSLSTDHLKYHQSLSLQKRNVEDPFSEPTALHSNIRNGHGVFASSANTEVGISL